MLSACANAARQYRLWGPALLALAVASICGCRKGAPAASGELVGAYQIAGALIENTCGSAALPTVNPLRFAVEIRRDNNVGYWQVEKRAAQAGLLEDDGSFRFLSEQTSLVGQGQAVRNDLQPQDFLTLDPDFDLKRARCLMTVRETIKGRLGRALAGALSDAGAGQPDGGDDAPRATGDEDMKGENLIEVTATQDSDCSASLQALGGPFAALPCHALYVLEGELQDGLP